MEKSHMIKTFTRMMDNVTVAVRCDESMAMQADSIFQVIERQNKKTPLFQETCMLRIGWCIYQITKPEKEGDVYQVLCPDFRGDPLSGKTEDLSVAIYVQNQIMAAMDQLHVDKTQGILFADTITVSQAVMPGKDITMTRMETKQVRDSGWTIVLANPDEEDKKKPMVTIPLCQILKLNISLMGLLALPAGTEITTSKGQKEFHVNFKNVEPGAIGVPQGNISK